MKFFAVTFVAFMVFLAVTSAPIEEADDSECCHCCCVEPYLNNLLEGTVIGELKMEPKQYDHDHHEPGQHPGGMKSHKH